MSCPECEARLKRKRERSRRWYQKNRERVKAKNLARYHERKAQQQQQ